MTGHERVYRAVWMILLPTSAWLARVAPANDRSDSRQYTNSSENEDESVGLVVEQALEERLDRVAQERVESVSALNISIGGMYVNGMGDRSTLHPVLAFGDKSRAVLLQRIKKKLAPFRELLLYHGLDNRITPLELRLMMLEEPTYDEIRRAREEVLASAGAVKAQEVAPAELPDKERCDEIVRLIDELYELEPASRSHWNVSLGPYDINAVNPVGDPHPLLQFGVEALPFLAAEVIANEYPLREFLIYNRILKWITPVESAVSGSRLPPMREIWYQRIRVIEAWHGRPIVAQAAQAIAQYRADRARTTTLPAPDPDAIGAMLAEIPSQRIEADQRMSIALGGYYLAGPRQGRNPHPILKYGPAGIPFVVSEMKRARVHDRLPYLLVIDALERRVTRFEAELFLGNEPESCLIEQRSMRLLGYPDVREPVSPWANRGQTGTQYLFP